MRPEGVAAATRELKRALRATKQFVEAGDDFESAEDAYDTFLTHAGRVYEKLRAACHGHPLDWRWWKKKMDERRDDELLVYVHKARNAETHRLENSTIWLKPGNHQIHLQGYGPILETIYFGQLQPLSVTDREGNVFEPPCRHRQRFFGNIDCGSMIWLAGAYLSELVQEAASRIR